MSRLAMVFAQSIEGKCHVENEDVVREAQKGDAPIIFEWSTVVLHNTVRLIWIGL